LRTLIGLLGLAALVLGAGLVWGSRAPGAAPALAVAPRIEGRIAYASRGSIYLWSGGKAERLTSNDHDTSPSLSPDGAEVAFARVDPIGWSDLYMVPTNGGPARPVTDNRPGPNSEVGTQAYAEASLRMLQPAWSADGSRLAFISDSGTPEMALWVADGAGEDRHRLTQLQGGLERPVWSPDGTEIAATTYGTGRAQVWSYNLNTGEWREIAAPPDGAYDPAWSPDGRWIVYTAREGRANDLWVVPADRNSDPVRLTSSGNARSPAWAPSGTQVAFIAEHDGTFDLYVLDITAGDTISAGSPQQVTSNAALDAPSGLSWSR
jgi:TolB protein